MVVKDDRLVQVDFFPLPRLDSPQINQRMLAGIAINNIPKYRTAGTEDYLMSSELNLTLTYQSDISVTLLFIQISEY